MKYNKNLTKIIKFRVEAPEYEVFQQEAEKRNLTISQLGRDVCFGEHGSLYIAAHREIVKEQMYNILISTKMPTTVRQSLIKELNKID